MLLLRLKCLRLPAIASLGVVLAVTLGPVGQQAARAQGPTVNRAAAPAPPSGAKQDDPKARARFDEVAKAYRGLSAYSDHGEFTVAMTVGGKSSAQVVPLKITIARPDKFDIETNVARLTSDGKTLTTVAIPFKQYLSGPAPERPDLETFREGVTGAALFGGPSGLPMFVLLSLLTSPEPAAAIGQVIGGSFQLDSAHPDDKTVVIEFGKEKPHLQLTADPATMLLSSIDIKVAPEALKDRKVSVDRIGWSAGAVATQLPKDQSFTVEIPKGYAKVDALHPGGGDDPAKNTKLGKPAPDFTLTLLDGPGKTKTVTKAELAGKVIVIDFWATWCKPCLMELPEIQKLIESYAGTKKEVLVVALSQDEEPSEITQLRKLVEKTLDEKKINLTSNAFGKIGLDPSKSVGTAFELEGYPTLVIIDGKGIVQSMHAGFNSNAAEPLHKTLGKEIDTLLEGKSLVGSHEAAKKEASKR